MSTRGWIRGCGEPLSSPKTLRRTAITLLALQTATYATTRTWTDAAGTGLWSTAGNWSPAAVPVGGDIVDIFGGPSIPIGSGWSVTYDYAGPAVTLNTLNVTHSNTLFSHGSNTLTMNAGALTVTNESFGDSGARGNGALNLNGDTNTVQGTLVLGNLASDTGAISLNSALLSAQAETIGESGAGIFTQSGTSSSHGFANLTLADQPGSVGTYNLLDGLLSSTGTIALANHGTATFTQSGGGVEVGYILIAQFANSTGTYTLQNGTLAAHGMTLNFGNANATFNQSGGLVYLAPADSFSQPRLSLGVGSGGLSNYTLSGGTLNFPLSGQELFGAANGSIASFTQSGGLNEVDFDGTNIPEIAVGYLSGSTATYSLSNGSLQITGFEVVGLGGIGTFTQTGGNNTLLGANGGITVGLLSGASGAYSLSNGSINAAQDETIGYEGVGAFTQTGGSNTAKLLNLGAISATGTYSLSGGNLTCTTENIGLASSGTFTQSGGTNNVFVLQMANNAGSFATYRLSAGNLTTGNNEFIAGSGIATFIQTGGNHTLSGSLAIGVPVGGVGSYSLSGASLLSVGASELVGSAGTGTFTQTGGTHTISTFLAIAASNGSIGNFTLNGGSLTVPNIYIGGSDTGIGGAASFTFNSPASLNVSNNITLFANASLSGNGFSSASVITAGSISPGTPTLPGILTLGNITANTGARFNFRPGDLLASSANINLAGNSTAFLNGLFPNSTPLMPYAGTLTGAPSNLSLAYGSVGMSYRTVNDIANRTLLAVPVVTARHSQISVTNQPSPDGYTFSLGLSPGAINNAGQINFLADMANFGPIRFDGAAFSLLGITGQPVPGPGAGIISTTINYADNINASGQTAWQVLLSNTTDGSTHAVLRADPNSLIPILRDQQVLPNNGGTVTGFPSASSFAHVNNAGEVAVTALLSGASDGAASAIYRGDGTTLAPIARNGQPAPGLGGGTFDVTFGTSPGSYSDPIINNAGQVAFFASLIGTSDGSSVGIFRGDGTTATQLVRNGQPAPGPGAGTFSTFLSFAFNDANQAAFYSFINGSNGGIFRTDGNTTTLIARGSTPAPGAGAGNFTGIFGSPLINASGQIAFPASLTSTTNSSISGIFRGDGNSIIAIARDKQLAPGAAGATFSNPTPSCITAGGQVAFVSALANSPDNNAGTKGAYIGDGIDLLPIAITGQYVSTSQGLRQVGNTISVGQPNDFGQVPWSTFFLGGGSSGNFLFTPTLHWRSFSSGDWNTTTNWTLGLAPAPVHDVVIDPASPLTITGPSTNTAINSLTLATAATLKLSTGTLKIANPLTLAGSANNWTGLLDLASSKLIIETTPATKSSALASLRNQLAFAKSHAAGITSSTAPANLGLALLDNNITRFATFGGFLTDSSSLLIAPELLGDANVDGAVNALDLNIVLTHFGQSTPNWTDGNFDNTATIDLTDLADVLNNFGQTNPNAAASTSFEISNVKSSPTAAPEPTSLALLTLGAAALLTCRRRH